jgi:hypothetical protein
MRFYEGDDAYEVERGADPLTLGIDGGPEIRATPDKEFVSERTERGWQPWHLAKRKELI